MPRACVYTVLVNGYERLNEQPAARSSPLDFICFTDDTRTASDSWNVVPIRPLFPSDPARSQRHLKICAHRALPDYDVSLYIDNSVILRRPPEETIAALLPPDRAFATLEHSFRDTVRDEFEQVVADGLDAATVCDEQLAHYETVDPEALALRPLWSGLLLRRHTDPIVVAAMETWCAHVFRYSRRDQLSVWVALRSAGLDPLVHALDNHESRFHRWPVTPGRDRQRAGVPRALEVERELTLRESQRQRLESELLALRATRSWRWTAPLRSVRKRVG